MIVSFNVTVSFIFFCIQIFQSEGHSNEALVNITNTFIAKSRMRRFSISFPAWFPWPWKTTVPKGAIEICYKELGCFGIGKPWYSTLRPFPIPWDPSDINVRVRFYDRSSKEGSEVTLWPSITFPEQLQFNPQRRRTVFVTHGFSNDGSASWLQELKDVYLQHEDANFFIVDWGSGAKLLNYLQAASNTRIVGAEMARLIVHLIMTHGLKSTDVHLIGHSLGSHILGYASKLLPEYFDIGRITALDPAQPGFETASSMIRLSKNDALFVDVIHSDAKPFIPFFGFGMMTPIGHVDFYVNGGTRQPGCTTFKKPHIQSIKDLVNFSVEYISEWISCSHSRAIYYFIDSLKSECLIWGSKMNKFQNILAVTTLGSLKLSNGNVKTFNDCTEEVCTIMGLPTSLYKARGSFLVKTTIERPFCSVPFL